MEIHHLTTRSYEWVLEGDITACSMRSTMPRCLSGCVDGSETGGS